MSDNHHGCFHCSRYSSCKPIVFANVEGFWNPMLALIDHMERAGFLHSRKLIQPLVIDAIADIIPAIAAAAVPADEGIPSVIDKM